MVTPQDALHMLRIDQNLADAYYKVMDDEISDDRRAKIHYYYVCWMIEGGKDQYYHMSMWAATNRDLLQEWVLNYIIQQEWA